MEQLVFHVKKKDLVQIRTGRDKGKTGKILRVAQKHGRVVIEKLNMIKRHTKTTPQKPGGILEKEGPISASNVLLFCDKCGKGVRTVRKAVDGGRKLRYCRKCNAQLDK